MGNDGTTNAVTRRSTSLDVLASAATREQSLEMLAAMDVSATPYNELCSFHRRQFDEALAAEVSRASRGLSLVSVVVVEWRSHPSSSLIARVLFDLRSVLREYDLVRRIEDRSLGLILPAVGAHDLPRITARLSDLVVRRHDGEDQDDDGIPQLGFAAWTAGQRAADLLEQARAGLREIASSESDSEAERQNAGVLLWLDGFSFGLPVQPEPRVDGLDLQLKLPARRSMAQVRLRGSPAALPCRLHRVMLTDAGTLRFIVKTRR